MSERRYRHPQVNLRLPDELKEQIAELAAKHGRSMNAEMVEAISFYIRISNDVAQDPAVLEREQITLQTEDVKKLMNNIKNSVIEHLLERYDLTPKSPSVKKNA
ncbi:Arc family DNA-binding protein [Pantoea dispersa]|uniref:Arc family DNA-binding protein n=1 Tax=Pantoea dispersa TaxID=59814 RepID=UPI001F51F7D5|nr:Arc family DNA-binding protein [Pantoea dispersa]MCI1027784.1 Arc family DNA-binding protein [Pantoea dispersa]